MSELLNMGGYGGYVWPAWGIAALILAALILISVRGLRQRERELAELESRMPRRRRKRADRPSPGDGENA